MPQPLADHSVSLLLYCASFCASAYDSSCFTNDHAGPVAALSTVAVLFCATALFFVLKFIWQVVVLLHTTYWAALWQVGYQVRFAAEARAACELEGSAPKAPVRSPMLSKLLKYAPLVQYWRNERKRDRVAHQAAARARNARARLTRKTCGSLHTAALQLLSAGLLFLLSPLSEPGSLSAAAVAQPPTHSQLNISPAFNESVAWPEQHLGTPPSQPPPPPNPLSCTLHPYLQ